MQDIKQSRPSKHKRPVHIRTHGDCGSEHRESLQDSAPDEGPKDEEGSGLTPIPRPAVICHCFLLGNENLIFSKGV